MAGIIPPMCFSPLKRLVQALAATAPLSWVLARTLPHVDRRLLRWSDHRFSLASWLTGLPIVTLFCTGARTRRPVTVPLVALIEDDCVVLIASNFGNKKHPQWVHNLRAHPHAEVAWGGQRGQYQMREATPEERSHYWAKAVALYRGYAGYKVRAAPRVIPILVLEPVAPQ